jgi:hypothetical protein
VALLFVVLTAVVVIIIGLVSVGGVTARLAAAPPRSLFDLDEAVEFVAGHVPDDVTAELSYDDVRALLGWHLEYLEARGLSAEGVAEGAVDLPVVTGDDEGVAHVLGRAAENGLEVDDVAVVEVIEAEGTYLRAIGALGDPVDHPSGEERTARPGS